MSLENGLAECGTEFEPVETVVCSEESIRDSLDFQQDAYCEEQVDGQQSDGMDDEPENMVAESADADSPSKSNGLSDLSPATTPNGQPSGSAGAIGHQQFWDMFTGLKVKQYADQELEAFKLPFLKGWRREVVLRGTVSNSGKKIGDVYYYSPDKKTKLRSYVEMGLFLRKNSGCGLEPENFTFARQPVYKSPEEIVRHAMSRGSNQAIDHFVNACPVPMAESPVVPTPVLTPVTTPAVASAKAQVVTRRSQSTSSSTAEAVAVTPDSGDAGQPEGRAKRKRVAPTRFEDEEYLDNSPFKKKTEKPQTLRGDKTTSPLVTSVSPAITSSSPTVSAAVLKTAETRANVTGRTGIIIRTAIRRTGVPTAPHLVPDGEAKNPLVSSIPVVSANGKPAVQLKEKQDVDYAPISAPVENADSNGVTAVRSSGTVLKPEPKPAVHQNGSLESPITPTTAPPPLQPIRIVSSVTPPATAPAVTPALLRKESRPVAQMSTHMQPSIRKPSILGKGTRSILSQSGGTTRIISDSGPGFKPIRPKPSPRLPEESLDGQAEDGAMVPPCSMMCGGQQGQLPGLLCSRCLCLFHPQCVRRGIHLSQGNDFVCPNCIQPSDQGRPIALTNGSDDGAGSSRQSAKTQSSSRNSSRAASPLHFSPSLIRNQQQGKQSIASSRPQSHQDRGSIGTMMDKRQQSQMQLLQTFQQIAGIRATNRMTGRPAISRPVPLIRKQQVVQNRGHLRLATAVRSREPQILSSSNHLRNHLSGDGVQRTDHHQQESQHGPQSTPPATAANHQHLSELISHHLDSVSRLLQEITMLKYSNCQKASSTKAPIRRKRSNSV